MQFNYHFYLFTVFLFGCSVFVGNGCYALDILGDKIESDIAIKLKDIKSPDDIVQIVEWKERCRDVAGEEVLKEIEDSPSKLTKCIFKYIKIEKVMNEVNISIGRGELDAVFKKYCKRRDKILGCLDNMIDKINQCTNEDEKKSLNVTHNALDVLIDFICYDGGSRIALFLAEKGIECVKEHRTNIQECVEKIPELKGWIDDPVSISPENGFSKDNCKKIFALQNCIVSAVEKCEDPTPANLIDSLIIQMLKVTPCQETSSANILSSLTSHFLTIVSAALIAAQLLL